MKRTIFVVLTLFIGFNAFGQYNRNSNRNRIPQTSSEPTEEQIAKRQREIEERKEEYINNFLTTLDADEFQRHIVSQKLIGFFDAKVAILKTDFDHNFDRQQAIKNLENTYFTDLNDLISEKDMLKIKEMIKGDFDEKEVVKKKKKKKKRRKNKKNSEEDDTENG